MEKSNQAQSRNDVLGQSGLCILAITVQMHAQRWKAVGDKMAAQVEIGREEGEH